MNYRPGILLMAGLFLFLMSVVAQPANNIVPKPVEVQPLKGNAVVLQPGAVLYYDSAFSRQATYLQELVFNQAGLRPTLQLLPAGKKLRARNAIVLQRDTVSINRPEMYRLAASGEVVLITARDVRGIVNAAQTLLQLLPLKKEQSLSIQPVLITDYPRFDYRGMHLDVVRHFFSIDYVKKYIDYLAFHKLNTFHWHLTDDQGWRIESLRYPKLNTIGSWRDSTLVGHFRDTPARYDGQRYGGYYTRAQIKEVLDHAAVRGITVIPEIDIPGHARAIIAAYPGLSTRPDTTWRVATTWGMYNRQNNVLAPNDSTFAFIQNIFRELTEIFPSTYIHIGGDECSHLWWQRDPKTQAFIRQKGLKNEAGLQTYFTNFAASWLKTLGRQTIGWHEITDGKVDTSAIIMNWADDKKALEVARKGYRIVMTPGKPHYFDHYQSKDPRDSLAIHGYNPLEAVYRYSIVPERLVKEGLAHKVIGGQANLWTEYVGSEAKVDYMVLPRMSALGENLWSQPAQKNYTDFLRRLETSLIPRYEFWKSNYFKGYREWDMKKS